MKRSRVRHDVPTFVSESTAPVWAEGRVPTSTAVTIDRSAILDGCQQPMSAVPKNASVEKSDIAPARTQIGSP
jgi:hypothetical protein